MNKLTTETFIKRAIETFGSRFDYSGTVYSGMRNPITVLCRSHGEFLTFPQNHLRGVVSCQSCNGQGTIPREEFIERSRKVFSTLDYSLLEDYSNVHSMITLRCTLHDEVFRQELWQNLRGIHGCPLCKTSSPMTFERFIFKSSKIWDISFFDYSFIDVSLGVKAKQKFICLKHSSEFEQSIDNHFQGRVACSSCFNDSRFVSSGESELKKFVESLGVDTVSNDRLSLSGLEIDVFVPSLSLGVEFNGTYWHSDPVIRFNKGVSSREYHLRKLELARKHDISLAFVWEDDWNLRRGVVESALRVFVERGVILPVLARLES